MIVDVSTDPASVLRSVPCRHHVFLQCGEAVCVYTQPTVNLLPCLESLNGPRSMTLFHNHENINKKKPKLRDVLSF